MAKVLKRNRKGFFISFEGGEGAGKSTQIRMLVDKLKKQGHSLVLTLEPGGTKIGHKIRQILLDPDHKELVPRAELLLYEADRAQHVDECILPALSKGKVVITDRYADSSAVYQGICRKLGLKTVIGLNEYATSSLFPDLVFVLDIPESIGLDRVRQRTRNASGRLDRMEREKRSFHRQVRLGFLHLSKKYPKRIQVINAARTPEEIHADILQRVQRKMGKR